MPTKHFTDYYKVLNIGYNASSQEIRDKYRQLAQKYHPDLNTKSEQAKHMMQMINEAYRVLGKSDLRVEYNKEWLQNIENRRPATNTCAEKKPKVKRSRLQNSMIDLYEKERPKNTADWQILIMFFWIIWPVYLYKILSVIFKISSQKK